MQTWLLFVAGALFAQSALAQCPSGSTHYGNAVGCLWRLPVTHDVTLERPTSNMNNLRYLLVGKHPQYPNKRSLIKTRNPPSTSVCENVIWAKLYVYFQYAHKASWHSNNYTPYRSRPIQVYQVNKWWSETSATSHWRYGPYSATATWRRWSEPYLEIIEGRDAGPDVLDTTTVFTGRPSSFVEFDVTQAVHNWRRYWWRNYGLLLRAETEYIDGRGIRFISNRDRDRSKHAFINVLCGPEHGQVSARSAVQVAALAGEAGQRRLAEQDGQEDRSVGGPVEELDLDPATARGPAPEERPEELELPAGEEEEEEDAGAGAGSRGRGLAVAASKGVRRRQAGPPAA